jgi:hypothetical protein
MNFKTLFDMVVVFYSQQFKLDWRSGHTDIPDTRKPTG